jgi:hypothetical protein
LESRQGVLLIRAFRAGLLNLSYDYTYSRAREQFILALLEQEMLTDIVKTRLTLDSQLISFRQKEAIAAAYEQLDKYIELTLPYLTKKDTINKAALAPISSDADLDVLRKIIADRKKKEAEKK